MKKYRGYFIDGQVFKTEAEVDEFILDRTILEYRASCRRFNENPDMEHNVISYEIAVRLHDLGLSWDEIEQIENEEFAA